jgi:hypothetical protein
MARHRIFRDICNVIKYSEAASSSEDIVIKLKTEVISKRCVTFPTNIILSQDKYSNVKKFKYVRGKQKQRRCGLN